MIFGSSWCDPVKRLDWFVITLAPFEAWSSNMCTIQLTLYCHL